MDTVTRYLTRLGRSRNSSPSSTSHNIYEALPYEEYEDIALWPITNSVADQGCSGIHAITPGGIRTTEQSLPVYRFLKPNGDAKSKYRLLGFTVTIPKAEILIVAFQFLLPSFLRRIYGRHPLQNFKDLSPPMQSTMYLNGVRGFAAFFVYLQHYAVSYYPYMDNGYLSSATETRFLQMPLVRIIYSGRFMVSIFFVLSGFVLSYKPLKLLRKNDPSFLDCLASSGFRRTPRLFLPCIAPMFAASICIYNNWYGVPGSNATDPNFKPAYQSFLGQAMEEWRWFAGLVNPFTWVPYQPLHAPQLWTLPMEFRGSMIVFLTLLCLSKAKVSLRISVLVGFAYYCLDTGHWDTFLFVSGILFAEARLIKKETHFSLESLLQLINIPAKRAPKLTRAISSAFWLLMFLFGLFLGSWPVFYAAITPGFQTLSSLTPLQYNTPDLQGFFWNSIGAIMVMLAFENLPLLQRPFATAFARYLGDISFAFYIVHWTVIWSIGRYITNEAIAWYGNYHWGFATGALIVTPMTVWVADVHWRMFDETSVRVSRWLWIQCSASGPREYGPSPHARTSAAQTAQPRASLSPRAPAPVATV